MTDLITRLFKLDAPDRGVDAEICVLFQYGGGNSEGATNVRTDPDWDGDLLFEIGNEACCNPIPKLTASVDAAIALAERVLPGFNADLDIGSPINGEGLFGCRLWRDYSEPQNYSGEAFNPATAICIALLRAKEASKP